LAEGSGLAHDHGLWTGGCCAPGEYLCNVSACAQLPSTKLASTQAPTGLCYTFRCQLIKHTSPMGADCTPTWLHDWAPCQHHRLDAVCRCGWQSDHLQLLQAPLVQWATQVQLLPAGGDLQGLPVLPWVA
jgi:hypothetical protein